jgi:hypothetical protein
VEQLTTRNGRVEARSCVSGLLMDLNEAECFHSKNAGSSDSSPLYSWPSAPPYAMTQAGLCHGGVERRTVIVAKVLIGLISEQFENAKEMKQ